jgi:hypothetical protein
MHNVLSRLSFLFDVDLNMEFGDTCSRRKSVGSNRWMGLFSQLCLLSIVKSLLIDAQTNESISDNGPKSIIAGRIDSAYKALVSIFAWAAESDLLVAWLLPSAVGDDLPDRTEKEKEIFDTLCCLVQRDKWKERGIKSSKDFLMGLGSGFYNDGTYNGFYIQRYGLTEHQKSKSKSSTRRNEETVRGSPADLGHSTYEPSYIHRRDHVEGREEGASEERNAQAAPSRFGTYSTSMFF